MSMDVSTLAIEVTTKGIKEASDALGSKGLARAAENADTKVASLTANLGKLMMAGGNVTGSISGLTGVMALINNAIQSASANAAQMAQNLGLTVQGMNNLTNATQQSSSAMQRHAYHGGVVKSTLKAMATAALAYFSINSAKNIIEEADAWGMMQAKLKLTMGTMEDAKRIQGDLFNLAQNMRSPLDDMGKLFNRLQPALARFGKTSEDTKHMVESVALALKLQGATGAEAASTMLQFSQSANAGRLNGAEFNAVAENGVNILRALEEYLGKNQAELKKMGSEGKLTFDIISAALERKRADWERDLASLPMTFDSAMQRIKNAWLKAIGEMGSDTALGKRMADVLAKLEADIPRIAETVVGAVGAIVNALAFVIDHAKAFGTAMAIVMNLAIGKWAAEGALAVVRLAEALGFAGMASAAFNRALTFMGGPLGIAIGLIGAAVTAWNLWSTNAVKDSDFATKAVNKDTDSRISEIREEIAALERRNKAAKGTKDDPLPAEKLSEQTQEKLNFLIAKRMELAAQSIPAVRAEVQKIVDRAQAEFENSLAIDRTNKALKEQLELGAKKDRQDAARKDFKKKFATPAEAADAEIADWKEKLGDAFTDADAKRIREKHLHTDKKAETQAEKEQKAAEEAAKNVHKLGDETEFLISKMVEHHAASEKITAAEREEFVIKKLLEGTTNDLARAKLNGLLVDLQTIRAREQVREGLVNQYKLEEEGKNKQLESIAAAEKELATIRDKIAEYSTLKGVVEDYTLAQAKAKLAAMQMMDDGSDQNGEITRQQQLIAVLEQVAAERTKLSTLQNADAIDKWFDSQKVADFGNAFGDAFGKVGKGIDKAGKALDQYQKKLKANAEQQKRIDKELNPAEKAVDQQRLRDKELRDTLDMYGDMAGAVKGFFKEKTAAYKVFDGIEKGLRVARMALDAEEFATKIADGWAWITEKVAQGMAAMGIDTAVTTTSIANSEASAVASTAAGVAKAFEQLGVWGFVGAAAIIAFMATMGVGGGGGGNGGGLRGPNGQVETLEQRQKRQGTGTVLGDDTAKSESLAKALDALKDNSNIGLEYTASMAASLRHIDQNIGGLTATVARVNGMTTGLNMGIQTGTQSHGGLGGLFGGKTTTDILDTGLYLRGKFGSYGIGQYADVQTTSKSSGFLGIGGKTKTNTSRTTRGVDQDIADYVGSIFNDIYSTILKAGDQLGTSTDYITDTLKNFNMDVEVSLKDLKGKDLEDALNAMFSSTADKMTEQVMPQFKRFQLAGEGMFETVVRVSTGMERAKDALSGLGVTMVNLSDIDGSVKDVDAELVRSSLIRQESGTSLAKILGLLDGSMEDIVAEYKTLIRMRSQMEKTGLGTNLSLSLIRGAGGLSELSSAFDDYFSGMFTDVEQNQLSLMNLRKEFKRLNLDMPATKEGFKALVQQLIATGPAGEELAGRVLALSGSFADAMNTAEDLAKTAHDELADKISNAKDALKEAYNNEADALANVRDKMRGFSDALKDFKDELIMGDMSTKSELEKYQTALAKYNDVSSRALNGDEDAIGQFTKVAQDLLQLSRSVNASGSGYTADYERVLAQTDALEKFTDLQATNAQTQMDALKKQVEVLVDLDDSVKSVAQAIAELVALPALSSITVPTASAAAGSVLDPVDVASATSTMTPSAEANSAVQAAEVKKSNDALLAEIQALRQEVSNLRTEQQRQTEAIVTSNHTGPEEAADKIIAAESQNGWAQQQRLNAASSLYS